MKTFSTFLVIAIVLGFFSFGNMSHYVADFFSGNQEKTSAGVMGVYSTNAADNVTEIVAAAEAFKASLSSAQVDTLQYTFDSSKAQSWSNLPCGNTCRYGIPLGSLDSAQFELAKALLKLAAGTAANEGYDEFFQIVTADSILATASSGGGPGGGGPGGGGPGGTPPGGRVYGGGTTANAGSGNTQGYGKGLYYISFLNEPSTTD